MHTSLLDEVEQFLPDLESTQLELIEVFDRKRIALTQADAQTLLLLHKPESQLVDRLQRLLSVRANILDRAEKLGLPAESLRDLVSAILQDSRPELLERIDQARAQADALRNESWIHWIISNRAYKHYTEVLDIIAHCGHAAATYDRNETGSNSGGALLDTSA